MTLSRPSWNKSTTSAYSTLIPTTQDFKFGTLSRRLYKKPFPRFSTGVRNFPSVYSSTILLMLNEIFVGTPTRHFSRKTRFHGFPPTSLCAYFSGFLFFFLDFLFFFYTLPILSSSTPSSSTVQLDSRERSLWRTARLRALFPGPSLPKLDHWALLFQSLSPGSVSAGSWPNCLVLRCPREGFAVRATDPGFAAQRSSISRPVPQHRARRISS